MELFRGDTFLKKLVSSYVFKVGDKLHIAILKCAYSKEYFYEKTIEIAEQKNEVVIEISALETSKLPDEELLLEIELTTIDGIVRTNQYKLVVKADGIYERN